MKIRLHSVEAASRANGPGLRAVVWVQGCTLGCPGCFNPGTHDPAGGYEVETGALVSQICSVSGIEGVSISGGEPFQQPEALAELLGRIRATPLSILVFTGYTLRELRAMPRAAAALGCIDVLVAGRYAASHGLGAGLLGSANQSIHLLTGRYRPGDFARLPRREVILLRDGSITLSGIAPMGLRG
jgi:anaerobic ribonucleoside-triphosphate reductase activating protein